MHELFNFLIRIFNFAYKKCAQSPKPYPILHNQPQNGANIKMDVFNMIIYFLNLPFKYTQFMQIFGLITNP